VKFRVEAILERSGTVAVVARQLDQSTAFSLQPSSRLGGFPLTPAVSQPRASHPDGSADTSLFVFTLADPRDIAGFSEGAIVILQP
jgi:hypothetical protein